MFLHIGENISVFKDDIVAILDKKTIDESKETKKNLESMSKMNVLSNEDNIKTYIIALDNNKEYSLYTSSISSITLLNRK